MDQRQAPRFHSAPEPPPPFAYPPRSQEQERFPDAPRTMPHAHHAAPSQFPSDATPLQRSHQHDPFRNHTNDPFLPNTNAGGQRRSSHGPPPQEFRQHRSMSSMGHAPREPAQPWPTGSSISIPPYSKSSQPSPRRSPIHPRPSSPQPFTYEHVRRNSIGAAIGPPTYYQPGPQAPPAPPTLGAFRHMPGSSTSESSSSYASQRLPGPRELPGLGPGSRQGSGMSISSLLDSNAPPSRSSQSSSHMRPPSPRRSGANVNREYHGQWNRIETPEKNHNKSHEGQPYPSASSPHHFGPGPRDSPEYARSHSASFHSHPTPPRPPQYRDSPRASHDGWPIDTRGPSRPSSQPSQFGQPSQQQQQQQQPHQQEQHHPRQEYRDSPSRSRPGPAPPAQSYGYTQSQSASRPDIAQPPPPYERPMSNVVPPSTQSFAPPYQQGSHGPDDNNLLRRNLLGQEPIRDESRRDNIAARKEERNGQMRSGFRGQHYNQPPAPSRSAEPPRSHPIPHEGDRRHDAMGQEPLQGYGRPSFEHARRDEHGPNTGEPRFTADPSSRRASGEDNQPSRPFLGIASDMNKRGRASPLPQAVKGVQAQYVGPANDPSIKNEFGKLFQGLGSGLGGLGNRTPSRQSPVPQRLRDDAAGMDQDGAKMVGAGSFGGKAKKPFEDAADEGRRTPFASGGRGGRKARQQTHQQVQVQNFDEDSPLATRHTPVAAANQHGVALPSQTREMMSMLPPMARPVVKVHSETVVASVAQQKRHHIGNADYDVTFTTLPHASTPIYDKWGYCMQYKPSRRFNSTDENCTFTIRVSHEFLTAQMREKLCVDRYVFGTEVYTDDTDPILAAIHSGWIRGSWPSEIDTSMMDLPPTSKQTSSGSLDLSAPPAAGPIVPPTGRDCDITLLVLPTLVKYVSSIRFGVKSRAWSDNHDGCSIMVIGVKWVDNPSAVPSKKTKKSKKSRGAKEAIDEVKESSSKRTRIEVTA